MISSIQGITLYPVIALDGVCYQVLLPGARYETAAMFKPTRQPCPLCSWYATIAGRSYIDLRPLSYFSMSQTGEICLNILKKEWSPAWSLQVRYRRQCGLLSRLNILSDRHFHFFQSLNNPMRTAPTVWGTKYLCVV